MPEFVGDEITAMGRGQFRADGLLEVHDRYLPGAGDNRPLDQMAKAAWSIDKRLIDCETGYYLTIAETLYDADGKVVSVRENGREQWLIDLSRRFEQADSGWPQDDGMFLACAAASRPVAPPKPQELLAQRLALVNFIDENTAMTQTLLQGPQLDAKKLAARKPATPAALLELMREQRRAWRSAFNRPYAEPAAPQHAEHEIADINNELAVDSSWSFKPVGGFIIDTTHYDEMQSAPGKRGLRADTMQTVERVDCASGLSVPVKRVWFNARREVVATVELSGAQALSEVRGLLAGPGDDDDVKMRGMRLGQAALATCEAFLRPAAKEKPNYNAVVLNMTADEVMADPDPAAVLLKVRAAVRRVFKL